MNFDVVIRENIRIQLPEPLCKYLSISCSSIKNLGVIQGFLRFLIRRTY